MVQAFSASYCSSSTWPSHFGSTE
uniref:Uncharacterized protein n=1 Tax=Arundo donax TaxID=35708 RepID=A0A0A9F316_ARUDO